MADDITRRRMQAEEAANADMQAKSYKHTSAYQIISAEDQAAASQPLASGDAVREALLRRARAKELGLDNLGYDKSKIGIGGYKNEAFETADDESRQDILGVSNLDKRTEQAKKDRAKRQRIIQRSRKQQFNATGDADGGSNPTPDAPENRQAFNSRRDLFQEPPGRNYNPYA